MLIRYCKAALVVLVVASILNAAADLSSSRLEPNVT